ncbi:tRNA (adenosine(37)-N6)-dimethylallyltransferase MiaA [Prevotella sp. P2-180]|uniref:tRNA (adenosine(37)-N6)-dimethylallyltransferase MiaA n=1 Tax=Prevotella sp. P2-180 TaxID=2024224 RepID=UPI000B979F00|nr:tRNA (adenosine(37)-N6)-dimethylallyltransferase MiaA [Prevotella sp. P2-180]MCI6337493.1 tRNA (adenosine(37)-N6)-dimethylallyltransferase MiaA [Prevotella sp.]OYP61359.1 tRNA (adenosine(37)-N6)-dimethylallyltransferase MiaA [Prevotella sp. P2-180]
MNTLIVITGPTAVGKTELCLRIAEKFNIPVINADSRQIFRGMQIGTAAPTPEQRKRVRHYFVDLLELDEYYNASMYEQDVMKLLYSMFKDKDNAIALLTGGSMMYIDAVCNGIDDIPTISDEVRLLYKQRLEKEGLTALLQELKVKDPQYYDFVDKNNPRRVVHGLEICHQTGRTYSSFRVKEKKQRPFRIIKIALNRDREELYSRINRRVDEMMENGMVEEARLLLPYRSLNALNTVGYKELFRYFDGEWTMEEAIERIKGNTRRYARKQLTWYKKDNDIVWFDAAETDKVFMYLVDKLTC